MNSPAKSPAPRRYFFARFQSLAQPKWWLPSGLIILGGICAWQYWKHPEWLGANLLNAQPQSANPDLETSAGSLLDDPLETLAIDPPNSTSLPISASNPLASPISNLADQGNSDKNIANSPLAQLTQPLPSSGKSKLSPLFGPLIPNFKNTSIPGATDPSQLLSTSPSVGQTSGLTLPTISTSNPLQQAMQRLSTNSGENAIQEDQPQLERQLSQPQPVTSTYSQPYYNYGGQSVPNSAAPYYNYGGQSVPNSAAPYYNNQPPAATSQQPSANPNYGYGGQSVMPNQPSQANPNQQQQNSPFNASIYRP